MQNALIGGPIQTDSKVDLSRIILGMQSAELHGDAQILEKHRCTTLKQCDILFLDFPINDAV